MRLLAKRRSSNLVLILTLLVASNFVFSCEPNDNKEIVEKAVSPTMIQPETLNIQQFQGDWLLSNSSIFDSILHFRRFNAKDSSLTYGDKFSIRGNEMDYSIYHPGPECANGLLSIDSSTIHCLKQNINLFFKGGYIAEHGFTYKAQYRLVKKHPKSFVLVKQKVIAKEMTAFYDP